MKKKIIWIIVAAVVLLGGIAAAILLWPANEQQTDSQELTLYWNVDKDSYKVTHKDAHSPPCPQRRRYVLYPLCSKRRAEGISCC